MHGSSRRHLLVIASQCDAMPRLVRLEEAASRLDRALRAHGECDAGLPDGCSLVYGALTTAEITARVEEAAVHAARRQALLVLGFLGHGFTPGSDHLMHFMGKESRPDRTLGACDVRKLVLDVCNHPGIAGTIVIVDTCMAAGAAPDLGAIAARQPPGGVRLAMMMGAGVDQNGYDLDFTRGLAGILESGIPGAGGHLTFTDIKPVLERQFVRRQDLSHFAWDSARAGGALWFARNSAARPALLGRARKDLREALTEVFGPTEQIPRHWDHSTFADLGTRLTDMRETAETIRALDLVVNLTIAAKTERFLKHWLGGRLTSGTLRRGLQAIDHVDLPEIVEIRDATEYVALEYPARDRDCRRLMARFLVAVGHEAGLNPRSDDLSAWATDVDAVLPLNDALADHDRLPPKPGNRLRLIVGLHGSITDSWPAEIQAWLQHGDQRLAESVFDCPAQSETATAAAVIQAVRWGALEARASGRPLERIEIAAPEAILHAWHPEELKVGQLLGVRFDVALRWSKRISPPIGFEWINEVARKHLERIGNSTDAAPITWLAPEAVDDMAALEDQLSRGVYDHALGLEYAPLDGGVLGLLFTFCPIVLWPQCDTSLPEPAQRQVHRHWRRLPGALNDACRSRLGRRPSEVPTNLRAVWDDIEWLDFCDHFAQLHLDHGSGG